MKQEITQLFEQVAELLNIPTTGIRTNDPTKDYYTTEWLRLDFASVYGGYTINIVHTTTAESAFDTYERKTKKEMIQYLKGLKKGLTYNQ